LIALKIPVPSLNCDIVPILHSRVLYVYTPLATVAHWENVTASKKGGISVAAESASFQQCGQAPAAVRSFQPKAVHIHSSDRVSI